MKYEYDSWNRMKSYTDGTAIQYLHYLPFGEEQIDQRLTGWNSRYTFSAKEKDVETGYSYFGARYYNSELSIWISVDPMSDKYPSLSPYVYCSNNPVILVDPNGRKIVIAGSAEFRKATFNDMQKISSNNLVMLKNGTVMEASKYKGDKSNITFSGTGTGNKEYGTKLMSDVIGSKHTVTVKQSTGENNSFLPTNANYSDAQNPEKGIGGTIGYDPESKGSDIVNKDGTRGVPAFIILGHELIHADKAMKGKTLNMKENISDPASPSNWSQFISKEEVDTRQKENILRRENDITKERLTP